MNSENPKIVASQVTKPIQLLAAWLVGLIAIDSTFLGASALISSPDWAAGALVVAAIANVPIFLACLFLLQTRFRPEMQEDSFYSRHLERRYSEQTQKFTTIEIPAPASEKPHGFDAVAHVTTTVKKSTYLAVNDLMPNYLQILNKLADVGLRPSETFGSTSVSKEAPSVFIVCVGGNTPARVAKKIIAAVQDCGLEGVGIGHEPGDRDRVYVGAYSYDESDNFLPVESEDFAKLLGADLPDAAFFRILSQYDPYLVVDD
jgi:hypothetical protein